MSCGEAYINCEKIVEKLYIIYKYYNLMKNKILYYIKYKNIIFYKII